MATATRALWVIARVPLYGVVALYAILMGLAVQSDKMIFQPHPVPSYSDGPEILHLRSADGTQIAATYLAKPGATFVVLFSHGNAEDLGDVAPLLENFRTAGFGAFAYDFPGYGLSGGKPSEAGAYAAEHAAYEYLVGPLRIRPDRIIVYGHSVGSGPAVELASTRPAAGLVIESGFTSAFRVMTHVRLLPWDKFNNLARIKDVHCPVLVIHGNLDGVVPFWHGEALFANANAPKFHYWLPNAGHNDVAYVGGEEYLHQLRGFAATLK